MRKVADFRYSGIMGLRGKVDNPAPETPPKGIGSLGDTKMGERLGGDDAGSSFKEVSPSFGRAPFLRARHRVPAHEARGIAKAFQRGQMDATLGASDICHPGVTLKGRGDLGE